MTESPLELVRRHLSPELARGLVLLLRAGALPNVPEADRERAVEFLKRVAGGEP
jgi:hypothetical protein